MRIFFKNLPLFSILLSLLGSSDVFAQNYEIPERPALKIAAQIPQNSSELSLFLAKGADATTCTSGKNISCTCLSYKNIHIRKWTPEKISGISYSDEKFSYFIESFNPKRNHYSGFWYISDEGWRAHGLTSTLEDIRFGKISKPGYCTTDLPKIEETAHAKKAIWSKTEGRWSLEGYQRKNTISRQNFSESTQAGFLSPTLFIGEDQYEVQGGYYVPVLRSQLLANLSTTRAGLGIGVLTQRPFNDELSQLEVGGRFDFESTKFTPFLNGNVFAGSRRAHIAGNFDLDEDIVSRPLVNRRLFQNAQRNDLGVLLSGGDHHLRISGTQRKTRLTKREISGEYTARFLLESTALDIHLRYQATDLESDAPLQSTTLSVGLNHRFGTPGLYVKPAVQLTNNFSTIPIDKGFDASTTGFMMAQLSAGMRFIGRFSDLRHIADFKVSGGRDLFGFQQRTIRDGGSPFSFIRQPDLTYAWGGLENAFLASNWNIEIPVGLLLDNIDENQNLFNPGQIFNATPMARFKFSADDLDLGIETMCAKDCVEMKFRAAANVDSPEWGEHEIRLSLHYGFSDYATADFMRSRIRESDHQMFMFQAMPNSNNSFLHSAHIKVGLETYAFGIEGYYSETFQGLLATTRLRKNLGWTIDSRLGWSTQNGVSAQFGFSANSRFFSR